MLPSKSMLSYRCELLSTCGFLQETWKWPIALVLPNETHCYLPVRLRTGHTEPHVDLWSKALICFQSDLYEKHVKTVVHACVSDLNVIWGLGLTFLSVVRRFCCRLDLRPTRSRLEHLRSRATCARTPMCDSPHMTPEHHSLHIRLITPESNKISHKPGR